MTKDNFDNIINEYKNYFMSKHKMKKCVKEYFINQTDRSTFSKRFYKDQFRSILWYARRHNLISTNYIDIESGCHKISKEELVLLLLAATMVTRRKIKKLIKKYNLNAKIKRLSINSFHIEFI